MTRFFTFLHLHPGGRLYLAQLYTLECSATSCFLFSVLRIFSLTRIQNSFKIPSFNEFFEGRSEIMYYSSRDFQNSCKGFLTVSKVFVVCCVQEITFNVLFIQMIFYCTANVACDYNFSNSDAQTCTLVVG